MDSGSSGSSEAVAVAVAVAAPEVLDPVDESVLAAEPEPAAELGEVPALAAA